jgi:tRNA uridine 5-carboxymethylaminomethyl modification enzyme
LRVGAPDVPLTPEEQRSVEIRVRYESYIERSKKHLDGRRQYERMSLQHVRFDEVPSLSGEGLERLKEVQPPTLGAAQRTRGVRDSDVTALLVHLKRRREPAATPRA